MEPIDWSRLFEHRSAVSARYASIWSLPVAPRYSDVLFAEGGTPASLLEIGAGDRGLQQKIARKWPGCSYFSFDVDRRGAHDFYVLDEVSGRYDLVCMFEVIEHVSPALALAILKKCHEVLNPGGRLMVTTPNIFYPPGYLRDATHVTPWCYDELGGIARLAGFEVRKMFRLYKESLLEQLVRRYCAYPLFRLLRIDYARQIMLVAARPDRP